MKDKENMTWKKKQEMHKKNAQDKDAKLGRQAYTHGPVKPKYRKNGNQMNA